MINCEQVSYQERNCLLSSQQLSYWSSTVSAGRWGSLYTSIYGLWYHRRGGGIVLSWMKCNGVHWPTLSNVLHQNIPCSHIAHTCCVVCSWEWEKDCVGHQPNLWIIKHEVECVEVVMGSGSGLLGVQSPNNLHCPDQQNSSFRIMLLSLGM